MHPEAHEIRKKLTTAPWPKFLNSMTISGFRGWTGQEIRFQFPVCVIAGENGTGKSTILKAAAAAYSHPTDPRKTFHPGIFFRDTAWEKLSSASITYKVQEGGKDREYSIRKPAQRWRPSTPRPKRIVIWQDIARTLPLEATAGYVNLARSTAREVSTQELDPTITMFYSSIMGRVYDSARLATSSIDASRPVGVVCVSGQEFSQFHQGAGEDATFDLLAILQNVPDTALIIIDELEASLHPRSQRRLVHFLLWLARTKHIQVIVSTHSTYVLEEVPLESRIFLSRGSAGTEVLYGITPELALNRMDDIDRPDIYLFAEDDESVEVTLCLVRQRLDATRVKCIPVGPENVVAVLGRLGGKAQLPVKAIGVRDADTPASDGCIRLPGDDAPERQLVEDILRMAIPQLSARLAMDEQDVRDALSNAKSMIDHHEWPYAAARTLGHTKEYLWSTMCLVWVQNCVSPSDVDRFTADVKRRLES